MNSLPEDEHQVSFWPSVSDLFMTLFIIMVALLGAVFYILVPRFSPGKDRQVVEAVGGTDMTRIKTPVNRMREAVGIGELLEPHHEPAQVVHSLEGVAEHVVKHFSEVPDLVALQRENVRLKEEIKRLQESADASEREKRRLQDQLKDLVATKGVPAEEHTRLQQKYDEAVAELNDKPPIIRIAEDGKAYRFPSGSATMTPEFVGALERKEFLTLAEEIKARNENGKQRVDTIEIIGHTDGQPIAASGNLDSALPNFLSGRTTDIAVLKPGSNNDLGLLRALAVRSAWLNFIGGANAEPELASIAVRCYSAGQTLPEEVSQNDPKSFQLKSERLRRIELRLTKLVVETKTPVTEGAAPP